MPSSGAWHLLWPSDPQNSKKCETVAKLLHRLTTSGWGDDCLRHFRLCVLRIFVDLCHALACVHPSAANATLTTHLDITRLNDAGFELLDLVLVVRPLKFARMVVSQKMLAQSLYGLLGSKKANLGSKNEKGLAWFHIPKIPPCALQRNITSRNQGK